MNGGKYCYAKSDVLINKYNIKDKELLEKLEIQKVATKLLGLDIKPDRVEVVWDVTYLENVHKYLFGDVYEWAGEFRDENLYKNERVLSGGSAEYADYHEIKQKLNILFEKYKDIKKANEVGLVDCCVGFLLELWSVHPFREGNTRTCITFLWHYLRMQNINFKVELLRNNPMYVRDSLVMANYNQKKYLYKIIADALAKPFLDVKYEHDANDKKEQYQIAKSDYDIFKAKYSIGDGGK